MSDVMLEGFFLREFNVKCKMSRYLSDRLFFLLYIDRSMQRSRCADRNWQRIEWSIIIDLCVCVCWIKWKWLNTRQKRIDRKLMRCMLSWSSCKSDYGNEYVHEWKWSRQVMWRISSYFDIDQADSFRKQDYIE